MLNVGQINYLNSYPIFKLLRKNKDVNFIKTFPSNLNRQLKEGILDISQVSSVEYSLSPDDYLIVPRVGICAKKEVQSVILFSKFPIEELNGKKIFLTQQSLTSINLLKIILNKFIGVSPVYISDIKEEYIDASLFIGDRALYELTDNNYPYTYDLCELWYSFTGMPFVFSLWLVNKNYSSKKDLDTFINDLYIAISLVKDNPEALALDYINENKSNFSVEYIVRYWAYLYYDIGEEEEKSLVYFYNLLDLNCKLNYYTI